MTLLQALVLGLVQGLTEFLPISSSGHLVLVPSLLGWPAPPVAFDVLLHAGSLLAVLAYFRREFVEITLGLVRAGPGRRFIGLLVIGTIPAAVVGGLFEEQFAAVFTQPGTVALLLMTTGLILAGSETYARLRRPGTVQAAAMPGVEELEAEVDGRKALAIGAAQAFAILPGISRSGATIAAGLVTGLTRPQAARFSFMLVVPILAGTAALQVPKLSGLDLGAGPLVIGFLAALGSSYLAIWGLIGYLQRRGLYPFAVYCLVAGAIAVILLAR